VTAPTVFISHTTRDSRDHDLAHRLALALQERGARVWIAPESLPVGKEWKQGLVAGVMEKCTHFLVILSAASVRSKWVLSEIGLAQRRYGKERDFRIMPLPTGQLGSFRSHTFLAKFQSVPFRQDFHAQLEAVAEAAELRPSVPEHVRAMVAEKVRDFVGREYAFDAFTSFLKRNLNGYFIIEGDPGVGKSAILAKIVERHGCIAHFNVRVQGINTAAQYLSSICAQLIARFGLKYATLPAEATQSGAFLSKLLAEAAAQLGRTEKLIVAVDALDEVDMEGRQGNILYLPSALPDRTYYVLTRRQTALPFVVTAPQTVFDLMQHRDEGRHDIQTYIRQQVRRRPGLQKWLKAQKLGAETFAVRLGALSQDNFMYIRYVLPDIERGAYAGLRITELPLGLENYYTDHWSRMGMTAKPLPRTKIRIVYVLAEAKRPVSRRLIAHLSHTNDLPVDELAVQEVLDEWDEFLREDREDGAVKYFHDKTYPLDTHCVSQSIITLVEFKDFDPGNVPLACSVFRWCMDNMWDDRGFFYYRILRFCTIRTSYMRWTQVWMFLALATLLGESGIAPQDGNAVPVPALEAGTR